MDIRKGDGSVVDNSPGQEDWLQSIIETSDGNFLGVGFSQGRYVDDDVNKSGINCSWVLVNPAGKVLANGVETFGQTNGDFWAVGKFDDVVEGADAYYMVGNQATTAGKNALPFLRLDKATLATTPVLIELGLGIQGFGIDYDFTNDKIYIAGKTNIKFVTDGDDGLILRLDKDGPYDDTSDRFLLTDATNPYDDNFRDVKVGDGFIVFTGEVSCVG